MGIDYSNLKFSKGTPQVQARIARKRARQSALDAAYAVVDARDRHICRASGRLLTAGAVDPAQRLERHHIRPRSLAKGQIDDPRNILTVSALVHDLIEAHQLELEGTDANGSIRWWWRLPKGTAPPFAIQSRRRSQRRAGGISATGESGSDH